MKEFKTYHPLVNFTYFLFVIIFSCVFMHPICLLISVFSSFLYALITGGKKTLKFTFLAVVPLVLFATLLNPVFNHKGITILAYFPNGNPLTLESIIYGFASAIMIVSVILYFSSYNKIMTSDKFIYLFGKIIPSLSLVFSMVLRFVPNFKTQYKQIKNAQKSIGNDLDKGSLINRLKTSVKILSVMITWSLESAVETSDSMKSRGYGLKKRTSYSNFIFDKRDLSIFLIMVLLGVYIAVGAFLGRLNFSYYPVLISEKITLYSISVFIAYFVLCIMPVIIEIKEVAKWQLLKQKI